MESVTKAPHLHATPVDLENPSFNPCPILMVMLGLLVLHSYWQWTRITHTPFDLHVNPVHSTVNPNWAPWWELIILPGIGETKAKNIIDFRVKQRNSAGPGEAHNLESAKSIVGSPQVFQCPADLDRVPGIGPKTVEAVQSELDFDSKRALD
jgi:hypothetical protein